MQARGHSAIIADKKIFVCPKQSGGLVPTPTLSHIRLVQWFAINENNPLADSDCFAGQGDDSFHVNGTFAQIRKPKRNDIAALWTRARECKPVHEIKTPVVISRLHADAGNPDGHENETEYDEGNDDED